MLLRCGFFYTCSRYQIWTEGLMSKVKHTLLRTIQQRKLQYFGHLIQRKEKQKLLMEGKIEGTRHRGKHRRTWSSDVTDWCGLSYTKCVRLAENEKE